MNVYSVRLIPQLKIKFCEWFGIASTMAIDELSQRLERIDQKMDRFDAQLRRIHRRQMALEAAHAQALMGQKKKQSEPTTKSAAKKKRLKEAPKKNAKTVAKVRALPLPQGAPQVLRETQAVDKSPVVLMLQTGEGVQKVVGDYFGSGAEVIPLKDLNHLPADLEEREILAVFFERNLLAKDPVRQVLQEMKDHLPKTRFIGLSNYLTLALARATDGEAEFATFLTQPVSVADLQKAFSSESPVQSASAGKD